MPEDDQRAADAANTSPGSVLPARIAIGIATRGRCEVLKEMLREIRCQTRQPDRILVCHTVRQDVAGLDRSSDVELLASPPGLARQRNAIVDQLGDCDAVLFLDDDFLMAPRYMAATLDAMRADPTIVVTTGDIIADGVSGPGLDPATGRAMIAAERNRTQRGGVLAARRGYGCNMAVRLDVARRHAIRFDERLLLHALSEDVDFTRRLGRHGRIVKLLGARGVHLGTKHGIGPGDRLGYSQVANPVHLFRKGSYGLAPVIGRVGRDIATNLVRSMWSEPYVDRRGRLRGNARAMADIVRGRLAPERILEL